MAYRMQMVNEKKLDRRKQMRGVSVTVLLIAMAAGLSLPLDVYAQGSESIKFKWAAPQKLTHT
jgi:hypothetical protein